MIWLYILCFGVGSLTGATLMALMVASRREEDRADADLYQRSDHESEEPGEGL